MNNTDQKDLYFNPRLAGKLNHIRRMPLTLIMAPNGSGKITSVRDFLHSGKIREIWHVSISRDFETWLREFLLLLNAEFPDLTALSTPVDIAVSLKKNIHDQEYAYVLDAKDPPDESVLRFLYHIAAYHIHNFMIIVLTSADSLHGFESDMDSFVNCICASDFNLNQEDIRNYFSCENIDLLTEEAALIYQWTNGVMPLVRDFRQEVRQYGKNRIWNMNESLALKWENMLSQQRGVLPDRLAGFLTRISPLDYFSIDDVCAVDEKTNGLLSADIAPETRKKLAEWTGTKSPAFLYYNNESGYFHIHYLLLNRFRYEFNLLPEKEKESLTGAFHDLKNETDITADIEQINSLLFSMQLDEMWKKIKSIRFNKKKASALSHSSDVRLFCFECWYEILCGHVQEAVDQMEKKIVFYFDAGLWEQGRWLIIMSLFMKLCLGNRYMHATEAFESWSIENPSVLQKKYSFIIPLIAMLLIRRKDWRRLEIIMASGYDNESAIRKCIRLFFLGISQGMMDMHEDACGNINRALTLAVKNRIYLPFIVFYEETFRFWPKECSAEELEYLQCIKSRVNHFRRNMSSSNSLMITVSSHLTLRQSEVAELVSAGLSNKEIAYRLNISENTVKTILRGIFQKLNINNRKELVRTDSQ